MNFRTRQDIWYRSFSALLDGIVRISGIPQDELEPEIRDIHQRRGTAEYSYLIGELPSLRWGCIWAAGPVVLPCNVLGRGSTDADREDEHKNRRARCGARRFGRRPA
jgi:hypothetical protein